MKTRVASLALFSMTIAIAQYAYAKPGGACVNAIDPRNDAIVGVWNGDLAAPPDSPAVPLNIAFNVGGTGTGMDVNDVGAGGAFGTVQTYTWKKIKRHNYEVLMSNLFDLGAFGLPGFSRLGITVTGALSHDCQVLSLTGKISAYEESDRTLQTPLLTLPVKIDLERVNQPVHMELF